MTPNSDVVLDVTGWKEALVEKLLGEADAKDSLAPA